MSVHSSPFRLALAACLPGALVVLLSAAQTPPPAPDVTRIGPKVGEAVPAFSLADQRGKTQDLASLKGSAGLMLVFFRSADW